MDIPKMSGLSGILSADNIESGFSDAGVTEAIGILPLDEPSEDSAMAAGDIIHKSQRGEQWCE
jgi:hypothetical protein